MPNLYPKYPSKWERAKRMFCQRLAELDNDGLATIEYFNAQVLHYRGLAKENPASVCGHLAQFASDAATYGVNLAFGTDLAQPS